MTDIYPTKESCVDNDKQTRGSGRRANARTWSENESESKSESESVSERQNEDG